MMARPAASAQRSGWRRTPGGKPYIASRHLTRRRRALELHRGTIVHRPGIGEVPAMCLSVREQRRLDTIGAAGSPSDAQLASILPPPPRLPPGEPIPDREQLARPGSRAGRTWHAVGAGMARLIAWLDRMDNPRV